MSLPRTGSTLLQRILSLHPKISSTSEAWILLPLLYSFEYDGVVSEYWHRTAVDAISDFVEKLPNKDADFKSAIRSFSLELYGAASEKDSRYFIDKTPRYHVMAKRIMEIFPDAKIIFLWRNPLAVVSSLISTFGHGIWNVNYFKIDLFKGLIALMDAFKDNSHRSLSVNYEKLISNPEECLSRIFSYLDLDVVDIKSINLKDAVFQGKMGDPTGTKNYGEITSLPLNKWKSVLRSPIRKWWCKRYIKEIGASRWELIGYQQKDLLESIEGISTSYGIRGICEDAIRHLYGNILPMISSVNVKAKFKKNKKVIYPYY
ncbi:MAG: sulfotransferase [Gammaproteobacteria bacterium]|nr:sulfotransferase [Gammaproteobacteria bacterium]